jgi:predicted TIM-barrel enzyme
MGFAGVQNFPTVGLYDGRFRQAIEETAFGYEHEVELIARARELDLLTAAYVFSAEDATSMAGAGADILVAHMGLTTSGQIGAKSSLTLAEAVKLIQEIHDKAKEVSPQVIVLGHGGPLAEPADVDYVFQRVAGIAGFFGASSMERLPTETAIATTVRDFKSLTFTHSAPEVAAKPTAP